MNTLVQVSVSSLVGAAFVAGAGLVALVVCFFGWLSASDEADKAKFELKMKADKAEFELRLANIKKGGC